MCSLVNFSRPSSLFFADIVKVIEKWKFGLVDDLLKKGDWMGAGATYMGFGAVCVAVSCFCVLACPPAASSGIPAAFCYLNGVIPPAPKNLFGQRIAFFGVPTLIIKYVATIFSIPSGLFVGPEGPIIHMGAMMGKHVITVLTDIISSHANSVLQKLTLDHVKLGANTERWVSVDESQKRDFFAIGAGASIAAAFSAPLAGVMFVAEEAASFLHVQMLELAFFASASAFWVTYALAGEKESHVKFPTPAGSLCSVYSTADVGIFVFM